MSAGHRIAVVTGAGSGIGRAVAIGLAGAGYTVVLAGRRREKLEETAAQISAGTALAVPTDVTNPESVAALFATTRDTYGRLDVLFNNAGAVAPGVMIEDLRLEDWRRVIDTNLTGPFLCTQQAIAMMKSQEPRGGRIINNGSIAAAVPRPNSAAYTASKHAITGLTRVTSLDGRKYDIACGQIDIGNARTELAALQTTGAPQANGTVMVEPMLDLQHVVGAVLYMVSLPLDANVQFLTVMATKMPFIGRG